jgi:hypothetical protein
VPPTPVAAAARNALAHEGLRAGGGGSIDEAVLYLIVLVGGGLLVGFAFRWWGLIASMGFACFLAYAWELSAEGVPYAVIVGVVASCAVVAGSLLRRALG